MNCLECQDLLQRRLDGEPVPAGPAFDDHLAGCPSCREQHAAALGLLDALQARRKVTPPADLAQRIVAHVVRDREVRRRRMRLRLVYTAALAASVLLLLGIGYLWTPTPGPAPQPSQIASPKDEPKKPALVEAKEPPRAVASLTERLADTTRDQMLVVLTAANPLDAVPLKPLSTDLEPLDPAAQSLRQAGQGVTEGVQTVTRAGRQAFSYFVRELPMLDVPQRN